MNNAEPIALLIAPFLKYFTRIAYPVVKVLFVSAKRILKLTGIKNAGDQPITKEELRQMIRSTGKPGVIEREESQMHQNHFFFADLKAKNLMTHRSSVEWIDTEEPIDLVSQQIQVHRHSKFPACAGGRPWLRKYLNSMLPEEASLFIFKQSS